MPFTRPTLTALIQQAQGYLSARLPGADITQRRSVIVVLSKLWAGFVNGEYGYLDYLANQLLPDTSTDYLARQASIWGIVPKPAVAAAGNVVLTGASGTAIPQGSLVQRSDGAQFATSAPAVLAAGTATVPVVASVGGSAGNTPAAAPMTLANAIAGVAANCFADGAGLTGGIDLESTASLRARLLNRIRQPPQAGNSNDYVQWALSQAGVTRAWVYPKNRGVGTVDVAFVMDGRANIIPQPADLAAVQAYINSVKPDTDDCVVFAPIAAPLALTIHGLQPNTAATQAAIAAAFADLLSRVAVPGGTIAYADIDDAIEGAAGVTYHLLTVPNADVVSAAGNIAVPGAITYT